MNHFFLCLKKPWLKHTQSSASCKKLVSQEKIFEICENFEKRKFSKSLCQFNYIQQEWTHSQEKVDYFLEMVFRMKIKGVEQFKQIYIVKTNYKFRIQSTFENKKSEFSEILITTSQSQSIEDSLLISKKIINNDNQALFEKPGLILGINPFYFGVRSWEIKFLINGIIEDLRASLIV
ncbi:unnamed protein product [Paramecium pentaurelia]|uniref:Uncharacterized protein n=1 Tax=Paramecium pentaurelia TaxID=43138 RepID=A0A8S1VU84_9CILI|nr:unnamed protein product [Paramecium pentaurelia]